MAVKLRDERQEVGERPGWGDGEQSVIEEENEGM